jgi:cyclic pyranopterin monophosphate synthase
VQRGSAFLGFGMHGNRLLPVGNDALPRPATVAGLTSAAVLYVARAELPKGIQPRRASLGPGATLRRVSSPSPVPPADERGGLTHVDDRGRASMVDVAGKPATRRTAVARAIVRLDAATRDLLLAGQLPKGEALAVARIAGIQAAKDTARLIPLCHTLPLDCAGVEFAPHGADAIVITATAATTGPTGVEMEAMVAASLAALTVYDMVKARCRGASVEDLRLLHKSGGKSGTWNAPGADLPPATGERLA